MSIKKTENTGQYCGERSETDKYQSFYENSDTENIKLSSSEKDHQKFHQTPTAVCLGELGGGRGLERSRGEWSLSAEEKDVPLSEAPVLDSTDQKNLEVTITEVRPETIQLEMLTEQDSSEKSPPSYAKKVRKMKLDWLDGKHPEGNSNCQYPIPLMEMNSGNMTHII